MPEATPPTQPEAEKRRQEEIRHWVVDWMTEPGAPTSGPLPASPDDVLWLLDQVADVPRLKRIIAWYWRNHGPYPPEVDRA